MAPLIDHAQNLFPHLEGFRVEIDKDNARADVILDRPPFNLVSMHQSEELRAVFELLDGDSTIRVIVLRAEGDHFSKGAESGERTDQSVQYSSRLSWNMRAPWRCSKPVICASRGYCFGASFELALACDFCIATETTLYAFPAERDPHLPELRSHAYAQLLRTVGLGRTKDILMRSRFVRGAEAYDWGIAAEFAADSELENATDSLVRELLAVSSTILCAAKKTLNDTEKAQQWLVSESESHGCGSRLCTMEVQEAVNALGTQSPSCVKCVS